MLQSKKITFLAIPKKNVKQIEILHILILYNILHTAEHFIHLVVGEKHFELECPLSL